MGASVFYAQTTSALRGLISRSVFAMGNASSSSLKQKQEQERQQALTVWMLAQEGDPAALGAFIAQIPSKLRASQLNYEEKADQRTPLAIATVLGHVDCVKLLLKAGADRNRVGRDGMGPLDLAIKTGNLTILRLLLMDAQVDCNVVDAHGYTPLLAAVVNKPTAVLELLLQCDRVNRFARHAKSGLNAIGIVCQAYEKAPSTDRIRLKARVELLEQVRSLFEMDEFAHARDRSNSLACSAVAPGAHSIRILVCVLLCETTIESQFLGEAV